MQGQLFINTYDAFTTWGATLQIGSLSNLLQRGEQKPFTENTSRSIDGKHVLPKNPRQDSRTFTVDISIKGTSLSNFLARQEAFFNELATGIVNFHVPYLNKTFRLIYKKNQMKMADYDHTFATFKITFEEPNPANR